MLDEPLTTTQLSALTGLRAGTLRMWETRYGFPSPARLPTGRHRYSASDVELVRDVLRRREQGLSLRAAIDGATRDAESPRRSIFAALRSERPDLQVHRVGKRALLALTHAIEDEHLARSGRGVVIGSFQSERNYRASEPRWHELARSADVAAALADFPGLQEDPDTPAEIPLEDAPEMHREWTLIVRGPAGGACLAAWEPPANASRADGERIFEAIWSFEPAGVRDALRSAHELIAGLAPRVARRLAAAIPDPPAAQSPELRYAADLSGRAFAYLAAEVARP